MPKFKVEIRELLERQITIEAKNEEDALDKVKEMYDNEEIVLNASDFMPETEFEIIKN